MRGKALPRLLRRYLLGMILLALLSVTSCLTAAHSARPWWRINGHDLMMFADQFKLFRRPGFWNFPDNPFTYPAPPALVFAAIYKLGHAWRDYTLACGLFALAWACWLATGLHRRGVSLASACVFAGVALATSWPIYFQLDSANIEAVVSVVLALGVLASWRGRWWWAAVLIGLAGALKIFPLVLLGLVLSQRKYKEFATGVATAFVVTVGSLAYVGPTIVEAQHSVASGLLSLRRYNLVPGTPMVANHSLWMLIKWAWVKVDWHLARLIWPANITRSLQC